MIMADLPVGELPHFSYEKAGAPPETQSNLRLVSG